MQRNVGIVTLGQSPRRDAVAAMQEVWSDEIHVCDRGALDGLSEERIADLKPEANETALVTQLRDGRSVLLSRARMEGLIQESVNELAEEKYDPIVIYCTGPFDLDPGPVTLVQPRSILTALVRALVPGARLGVLVPEDSQRAALGDLWENEGFAVTAAVASPYEFADEPEHFARAADQFAAGSVQFCVLDCMGYTESMREFIVEHVGVPAIVARTAVAHTVATIL